MVAKIEIDLDQERGQEKNWSQRKVFKTKFVVFLILINVVWFFSKSHFQTFKDCVVTLRLSFYREALIFHLKECSDVITTMIVFTSLPFFMLSCVLLVLIVKRWRTAKKNVFVYSRYLSYTWVRMYPPEYKDIYFLKFMITLFEH